MQFSPCTGKCTEDGSHCLGCGRTHEEVAEYRVMIKQLVNYAQLKGYENIEEYAQSIAKSVSYKLHNF